MILNGFGGIVISRVYRITANVNNWETSADLGLVPEIRFFKKVSLTLPSINYRYYFPVEKNGSIATSYLNIPTLSLMQMSLGLKFYY